MTFGLRRCDLVTIAALSTVVRPGQLDAAKASDPARVRTLGARLCGVTLDNLEFAKAIETDFLTNTEATDLAARRARAQAVHARTANRARLFAFVTN
jgi:hypothetical protein